MANLDTKFLKRCRVVTNYYEEKQGSWSIDNQLLKIHEELAEIHQAENIHDLIEECCDTILATITIFDLLGTSHATIQEIMEDTLQKVENRTKLTTGVSGQ